VTFLGLVLRDGRVVGIAVASISRLQLLRKFIGEMLAAQTSEQSVRVPVARNGKKPLLVCERHSKKGVFQDISFELYAGEVAISDRIMVMRVGRIQGIYDADKVSEPEIIAHVGANRMTTERAHWIRRTPIFRDVFALPLALFEISAAFAAAKPVFLTPENFLSIVHQIAIIGIMATGMTFVIMTGGIDLSIGPVLALAGVLAANILVAIRPSGGFSLAERPRFPGHSGVGPYVPLRTGD
jgi:hypothetical protein